MENNYITINYNNQNINIIKFISESDNVFNLRLNFIKKLEKNNISSNQIENLSTIWYYMKFKNCIYDTNITNKILCYENS
jgi:hypothetical protein